MEDQPGPEERQDAVSKEIIAIGASARPATKEGHGGPSLPSSPVSAALSGGGHRASLFAPGA